MEDYDAVVAGSAIHDRAWLPSGVAFVEANVRVLATRPTWLFSVGMVDALPRVFQRWAKVEGAAVVAAFSPSIRPRGIQLFSGVIRAQHLPPLGRLLFRAIGCRFGDYRDCAAIDAWADAISTGLARSPRAEAPSSHDSTREPSVERA